MPRERGVRGLEAVRDGVEAQALDEVCGTPDEHARVQIPRRHSNQAGGVRENCARRYQDRSDDAGNEWRASERAPHPEQRQNHKLESDARGDSRDHANTTVHRQSTDANAARSESEAKQGKGRDVKSKGRGKDAMNESCKEAKSDDHRKWFYCQKDWPRAGRVQKATERSCRCRGELVAASPHPHDTAAVVPLQCLLPGERHTSTFVIVMPCANSETSCESSSEQAVRVPGAGGIAPAETQQVRPIAAIPSSETYLMMDTCAGASIFQEVLIRVPQTTRRWHQCDSRRRQTIRCTDAGKKPLFCLRDGRKFQVRYSEADVSFPIAGIGEASQQGNWSRLSSDVAMLPGSSGEFLKTCVKDPNPAKLEKQRERARKSSIHINSHISHFGRGAITA